MLLMMLCLNSCTTDRIPYIYDIEIEPQKMDEKCQDFFNTHHEYIAWTIGRDGKMKNPNYNPKNIIPRKKTMRPRSRIHAYYFRLPIGDSTVTLRTGFYTYEKVHESTYLYIESYAYNDGELKPWRRYHDENGMKLLSYEQQKILALFKEKFLDEINVPYMPHGEHYKRKVRKTYHSDEDSTNVFVRDER